MNKAVTGCSLVLAVSLACGWSATPEGVRIPAVVDGLPLWVDSAGTPFVTASLEAMEPRSTGLAMAQLEDAWVVVDLDATPVTLTPTDCDPMAQGSNACIETAGIEPPLFWERTCKVQWRDRPRPTLQPPERKEAPPPKRPVANRAPPPDRLQPWVVQDDEALYALDPTLHAVGCLGGMAIAAADANGLFGLWRAGTWVVPPFAREAWFVSPTRALFHDSDADAWVLMDETGSVLASDLQPVELDPRVISPWRAGNVGFPSSETGFSARRGDACGWLDLDGNVRGGFTPGSTSCAAPHDSHGFAKTGEDFVWVPL